MSLIIPALTKVYKGETSFSLETPEVDLSGAGFCCLIGKNGSGKSTFGETLAANSGTSIEQKWYFLPQYLERFLFAEHVLDQLQNLLGQELDLIRLKQLLLEFGFPHPDKMLDFPFLLLSGGERRRMALVCVFYLLPTRLILDEPEIGVTPKENMVLLAKLNNLPALNAGLILISHNYDFIKHSTDLICLEDGKISRMGRTQDLLSDPEFDIRDYGVRFGTEIRNNAAE